MVDVHPVSWATAIATAPGSLGKSNLATSLPVGAPQIGSVGTPSTISLAFSEAVIRNSEQDSKYHHTNYRGGKVLHLVNIGDAWRRLERTYLSRSARPA